MLDSAARNKLKVLGERLLGLVAKDVCGGELARIAVPSVAEAHDHGVFGDCPDVGTAILRWKHRRPGDLWDVLIGHYPETDPEVITWQRIINALFPDLSDTSENRNRAGVRIGKEKLDLLVQGQEAARRIGERLAKMAAGPPRGARFVFCGGRPEAGSGSPSAQRDSITVDEANMAAMTLASESHAFVGGGVRQWAEAIKTATGKTCSVSTVKKTPLWIATMEKTGRGRSKGGRPKVVSLTPTVLATEGNDDVELQRLIAEQEADAEPSPLDDDPPDRPRKVRQHKRL